jgi:hypothetical protein
LIGIGVNVNPEDRWGATPLNDAKDPEIEKYLISVGAVKGPKF